MPLTAPRVASVRVIPEGCSCAWHVFGHRVDLAELFAIDRDCPVHGVDEA